MDDIKIIKSKNCVRFDLQLAEIGCIKAHLEEINNTVQLWGAEISGMTQFQCDLLNRLTLEFSNAEDKLNTFIHGEQND